MLNHYSISYSIYYRSVLVIVCEFYSNYSYSTSDMPFNFNKFGNQG